MTPSDPINPAPEPPDAAAQSPPLPKAAKPLAYLLCAAAFKEAITHSGTQGSRLIGIDPGTTTLGLALSDITRLIASGLETIRRTKFKADSARLLALIDEHDVAGLVLGLPLNLDGSEGPRAQASKALARNLAKLTPLPILLWDERLSTVAAERALLEADASRARRGQVIDKLAATIILQSALDRMRHI